MRLRGFYYNGRTVVVVVVVQLYINALSILTVEDDSCVSVLTLFERIPVFFRVTRSLSLRSRSSAVPFQYFPPPPLIQVWITMT